MKKLKCPKCDHIFTTQDVKEKAILDALESSKKRFNALYREATKYYSFSKPVFNKVLLNMVSKGLVKRNQVAKQKVIYKVESSECRLK